MSIQWEPNDPEPFAVNAVLEQLEWNEHHREMAVWREQQRQRIQPSGKQMLVFFCKCLVVALGLAALPFLVVYAVAAWFRL